MEFSKTFTENSPQNIYRNLTIQLNTTSTSSWWEIRESCNDKLYKRFFQHFPFEDCEKYLTMFMFNEKIFPSALSSIAVKG